ncbi:MAG TPA: hypothetical protein VGC79_22095 [Polyangiaceae bacterium]
MLLAAVGVTGNLGVAVFVSSAQAADVALTSDQTAAIAAAVRTALANIDPSLTGAAKEQAIAQALAKATTDAIGIYGSGAIAAVAAGAIAAGVPAAQVVAAVLPAAVGISGVSASLAVRYVMLGAVSAGASPTVVAEAIITTSANSQLAPGAVGTGLGAAAAELAKTDPDGASAIAQVVSNEGTAGMGQSFASSVLNNGGSQQLANAGRQNPNATGETTEPGGEQEEGTGGTTLPPCTNPSCT